MVIKIMNWFQDIKNDIEWKQTRKNIEQLKDKQTALNDGTPVTILGCGYYNGRSVYIKNEETEEVEVVWVDNIAEDIKPKFLWW